MTRVTQTNAETIAEAAASRTLVLMAALVAVAAVLGAAITMLFDGVAWYEAAAPCAAAGVIFILQARWSLKKVSTDPLSALRVTMAGVGTHFAVIVGGGVALILALDFNPVAVLCSLLAAFAICQPLSAAAIRRRILALPSETSAGGATSNLTRTPFAEASA